jgi:prepilin-type processing-associated H-X9-DG protein
MKAGRYQRAFTLFEAVVVTAILCVLIVVLFQGYGRRHRRSGQISCANNQKQITISLRSWALDYNDKFPTAVSITNGGAMEWAATGSAWQVYLVMSNELNTPKVLICPQDPNNARIMANCWEPIQQPYPQWIPSPFTNNNNVSYFASLDAEDTQPGMFLIGDANLTMRGEPIKPGLVTLLTNSFVGWSKPQHEGKANIGLADGSVQSIADRALRQMLRQSGVATNHLAVP